MPERRRWSRWWVQGLPLPASPGDPSEVPWQTGTRTAPAPQEPAPLPACARGGAARLRLARAGHPPKWVPTVRAGRQRPHQGEPARGGNQPAQGGETVGEPPIGHGGTPGRNRTGPGFGGESRAFRGRFGYRGARLRTCETLVPQAFPGMCAVNRSPRCAGSNLPPSALRFRGVTLARSLASPSTSPF
jgi:hypothetical protein